MKLTEGEYARLLRRRSALTITEQAAVHGIGAERVRQHEQDAKIDPALQAHARGVQLLVGRPPTLTLGEYARIARERCGWTTEQLARKRRVSRMTIYNQEFNKTATAQNLAAWWHTRYPAAWKPGVYFVNPPPGF